MKLENDNDPVDDELPDQPIHNDEDEEMEEDDEELSEEEAAEFSLLNQQLDQLDKALDAIEEKNDSINSKLRELLEESKQARLEMEADAEKQSQEPQ